MLSTQPLSVDESLPRHIAIIMDGNGRWAKQRHLPRSAGHHAGVHAVRKAVEYCLARKVRVLTLFAFSSENWRRPAQEVSILLNLLLSTLEKETQKLHEQKVRIRFIGDRSAFPAPLRECIARSELQTAENDELNLVIAANYGGRWDIAQSARQIAEQLRAGVISVEEITPELLEKNLSLADLPDPDLFIRTGGEQRISNFLLWQLAYTELYFTPTLWPDFSDNELDKAIEDYRGRQRRFGYTGEQVERFLLQPASKSHGS